MKATTSENASEPQTSQSVSYASMAPGRRKCPLTSPWPVTGYRHLSYNRNVPSSQIDLSDFESPIDAKPANADP